MRTCTLCDWASLAADTKEIGRDIEAGKLVSTPYVLIAADLSEARQLKAAQIFCRDRYPMSPDPVWRGETYRHDKIRIGYMSAEFHEQATAHLTADLYECHDRSAFELYAFATGKNDGSPMRKRLESAFDVFSDVSQCSDRGLAEAIRQAEIDILINLNGYFGGERTRVFALRPAPVQVNYLGYPATMGAAFMDYIVADKIVIPEDRRGDLCGEGCLSPGHLPAQRSQETGLGAKPHAPEIVVSRKRASYSAASITISS